MQIRFQQRSVFLIALGLFSSVCAGSYWYHAHSTELSFTGGAAFSNLTNTNQVAVSPFITNTYNPIQETRSGIFAGASMSNVFELPHHFLVTVGPAAYFTDLDKIHGTEIPASNLSLLDGTPDTLNYQFVGKSVAFMLESKLVYDAYSWQPFVLAGIGDAINYLQGYNEVPTDPNGTASPAPVTFGNRSLNCFAYEIGLGLSRQLFVDRKREVSYGASLGYRYLNFGNGSLGMLPGAAPGQTLRVNPLNTQAVTLSLTAAFN